MNRRYLVIIGHLKSELEDLEKVIKRIQTGWMKAKTSGDDLYLDGISLNLHGFYAGLEKIFDTIAKVIDESVPVGSSWQQDLLKQMTYEIRNVRPHVITQKTFDSLDEYRGFRHVVRNVYTFKLSIRRMKPLVEHLDKVFDRTKNDISLFIEFIENIETNS